MPASPADDQFGSPPLVPFGLLRWLQFCFGITDRVTRPAYAASGFGLALFKYAVEAGVIYAFTSNVFWPWEFLNPQISVRADLVQTAPGWLPWAWFVWTLPFLWIAVTMSVRRAADVGRSPWIGLFVLIPIVNLFVMLSLAIQPTAPGAVWAPNARTGSDDRRKAAALAIGFSLLVGGLMMWISVYWMESYGASLFLGTPLLMGASASYLYNRRGAQSMASSLGIGLLAVLLAEGVLLLVALEGVFCLLMAAPLVLPIGALGGLIGKAIADSTRRPPIELAAAILVLPLWAGGEALLPNGREFLVLSAVEIDAPPEAVWHNVIDFPDLPETKPWYFSWGIACPQRATISGQGEGAIRRCEFTTGVFVEPITVWDQPRRLAFDVTEQPEPLFELSPYRHVHPPHLKGYLRSTRGEFRLVPLSANRTRLEGRTWYRFQMFPQWYWKLWSDFLIHRIHERVLVHIKSLSETARERTVATGQRQKECSTRRLGFCR